MAGKKTYSFLVRETITRERWLVTELPLESNTDAVDRLEMSDERIRRFLDGVEPSVVVEKRRAYVKDVSLDGKPDTSIRKEP